MIRVNHTFAICAYKESPFLTQCIDSLKAQTLKSEIICATSTPNVYIEEICEQYNIPLFVNPVRGGIGADWNFAYSNSSADYVTLVHQDDVYGSDYLHETLKRLEASRKPLIASTDYYEIRNGEDIMTNYLLKCKRLLVLPWRIKIFRYSKFVSRRIFMFGNPICCPSVTYAKKNLPSTPFNTDLRTNCDWLAWLDIRELNGEFLYIPKILMGHRIHEESETSNTISDNTRNAEDLMLLKKVSPDFLANFIHKYYSKAIKSNSYEEG